MERQFTFKVAPASFSAPERIEDQRLNVILTNTKLADQYLEAHI